MSKETGSALLFESGDVIEVGCFAHARRKFFDAQTTAALPAGLALSYIRRLYEVETKAKKPRHQERKELREAESLTILADFKRWLDEQSATVLPKSPIGDAVGYALNHWTALSRYTQDGRLAIDNNAAERALRSICIGRKNWLFMGNHEGGRRAAIIFSLVESCKRNNINPFEYLRDVLDRVAIHPARRVRELLPHRWQEQFGEKAASN